MSVTDEQDTESTAGTRTDEPDEVDDKRTEMIANVKANRKRLEKNGAAFTRLVGELVVAHDVDFEIVDEMQTELVRQLAAGVREHEEMTVREVAIALWFELGRVEQMMSGDSTSGSSENTTSVPSDGDAQQREAPDDDTVTDRMFQ